MQESSKIDHLAQEQASIFEIDLSFLEYIKKVMQPHQKQFNILDFFEFIVDYCMKLPNYQFQSSLITEIQTAKLQQNQQSENLNEFNHPSSPSSKRTLKIEKIISEQLEIQTRQKKIKHAEQILDKLKNVLLWYKKQSVSFEMINEYILSCQNRILKNKNSLQNLSEYQNLPQRRVRLDQNVKLCIMPQGDSSRIKSLTIKLDEQNDEDIYKKQVFVVTSEYIRSIRVDADKLAKEGNKTVKINQNQVENQAFSKIGLVKNWYKYCQDKIRPQVLYKGQNEMKINAKKQLYIEKVVMSENLVGIITHQKDFLIKPVLKQHQKFQRGRTILPYQVRLGNLIFDIPDTHLVKPINKDKSKIQQLEKSRILMLNCHHDDVWITVNEHFVYVYILPLPDSNERPNDEMEKSSFLVLCEPLPAKATQAKLLTKQFLAIMFETSCVMILKLQLSSKKEDREKNRIYPTNKIYNDIKFICMDYHPVEKQLIFTDFGSYLIRLKFNIISGDIEREGPVYDFKTGKFLTQNNTNTKKEKSYHIEKHQNNSNSIDKNSKPNAQIHLSPHKQKGLPEKKDKAGMSLYAKPQNVDSMKIVKNSSRQNMILICLNKNTSTIITYEQTSVNPLKNGKNENEESDQDRLYNKTIKLWDIHYMNVYQTFTLSLQIAELSLQSNGLYIVTKQRGYLGFYPLLNKEQQNPNPQKKNMHSVLGMQKKKKMPKSNLGQKIIINGNQIFFFTQLQQQRNYEKIQQEGYENHLINYNNPVTKIYNLSLSRQNTFIANLEEIPAQIAQFDVKEKIYVLSDTGGDKKFNLHIYDMLGNKEVLQKGIKRTQKYGILQNYTNLKKINHFQFNILLWNKHSLKFVGSNMQQSFTIHWTFSCAEASSLSKGSEFDRRSVKSASKIQKTIQDICVSQNSFSVLQKMQNQLYKSVTLSIFHLESARLKYRIHEIRSSFKVLEILNHMILALETVQKSKISANEGIQSQRKSAPKSIKSLTRSVQQSSFPTSEDEEYINLFDLNSPLNRKCVFTIKYKSVVEKSMTISQIQKYETDFNNVVSHDRFSIKHHISLQDGRLYSLNNDDTLIMSCIFHLKTQIVFKTPESQNSIKKFKIFEQNDKYFLYTRQISQQIAEKLNYIPRTSDQNIKKLSKKVQFEYVGQSEVHERVLNHWEIDINQLLDRSTLKNLNYMNDLHVNTDLDIEVIVSDLTQTIIKFSDGEKRYKELLKPNENMIKIHQTKRNSHYGHNQRSKVSWILAEAQSCRSILCLSSPNFFQIHSQSVSYNLDSKAQSFRKLDVKMQRICRLKMDLELDKPVLQYWNDSFNEENKKIWEETKLEMIEYMKRKLSKKVQKQLNSPSSLAKKLKSPEKQPSEVIELKKTQITVPKQNTLQKKARISFSSNQINNMFRQWHISKNIQKQMKSYDKSTPESQDELYKEYKHIIQNPQAKQERIKYLLEFPQKIKESIFLSPVNSPSHQINLSGQIADAFSPYPKQGQKAKRQSHHLGKEEYQTQTKIQNHLLNKPESLLEKMENSLQSIEKFENSISLPKIPKSLIELDKLKSSTDSQMKLSKRKSEHKPRFNSISTNEKYEFSSPKRSKSTNKNEQMSSKITRTKTETTDRNYLQLMAETPVESLKSISKLTTLQKYQKKIHPPNPQSSLSTININSHPISLNSPYSSTNKHLPNQNLISSAESIVTKNQSIITRCKTQISNEDSRLNTLSRSAIMQLKESAKTINQSILPQIRLNREKFSEKMKQKKSFIKSINNKIASNRQQIRDQLFKKQKYSLSRYNYQ